MCLCLCVSMCVWKVHDGCVGNLDNLPYQGEKFKLHCMSFIFYFDCFSLSLENRSCLVDCLMVTDG